ncbi:MAG: SPOR domain-containing protein, partial [Burkholderiaceae bacterium]|nr:SPOR domain-containing protein [Burkholderiaceae bacterium]
KPESKANPIVNKAEVKSETKSEAKSETKPESKASNKVDKTDKAEVNVAETARALAILEGRPAPKTNAEEKGGKFSLQVAALATQEKVDELRARLSAEGIQSYTQKVATSTGDKIRVRVGPFASKEEAEKSRAKLVRLGLNGTLIPQ